MQNLSGRGQLGAVTRLMERMSRRRGRETKYPIREERLISGHTDIDAVQSRGGEGDTSAMRTHVTEKQRWNEGKLLRRIKTAQSKIWESSGHTDLSELLSQLEELAQTKGLRSEPIVLKVPSRTQQEIDGKANQDETFTNDGETILDGPFVFAERSADPDDPAEGHAVLWMSDGTGAGDDGDIMLKITAGAVTKATTLVDFSTL